MRFDATTLSWGLNVPPNVSTHPPNYTAAHSRISYNQFHKIPTCLRTFFLLVKQPIYEKRTVHRAPERVTRARSVHVLRSFGVGGQNGPVHCCVRTRLLLLYRF
jgi:hypothetical protein